MVATLTATPRMVVLPDPLPAAPPPTGTTAIKWNTDGTFRGRVFLAVDGGDPVLFAGGDNGLPTGSANATVELGKTYRFTLRRVSSNVLLASVVVTTVSEQALLIERAAVAFQGSVAPPQRIFGLTIDPGVDTVRIGFRTAHATIPRVDILAADGSLVAQALALFNGPQRRHRAVFGMIDPLPQRTELQVRITVPGRFSLGPQGDVVSTATFRTGRRAITVFFDQLDIHTDGDPGIKGAGEFDLTFEAGDPADFANSGQINIFREIDASDPPLALGFSIQLPLGPRGVFVRVRAADEDFSLPTFGGLDIVGEFPFGTPSNSGYSGDFYDLAYVGEIVDVSSAEAGTTTFPFILRTNPFAVTFTAVGRIVTTVTAGQSLLSSSPKARAELLAATLQEPGSFLFVGSGKGKGFAAGLGGDGFLWGKDVDSERLTMRREGWQQLAPAVGGPVTLAWTPDERALLVAVSAAGAALRLEEGAWRELGGPNFQGALAAAPRADRGVELFGLTVEGAVMHRRLEAPGAVEEDWRTIGEGVLGGLAAVDLPSGATAVFAIGRDGRPLQGELEDGRISGWQVLADIRSASLGVLRHEDGGLVVALLTAERELVVLDWAAYPRPVEPGSWQKAGPYDALFPPVPPVRIPA